MEAIIKVQTFNLTQEIFITDPNSATGFTSFKMPLDQIPDFLVAIENLENIHIFGNETFLKPTIAKIKEKEYTKYNSNKINISINK